MLHSKQLLTNCLVHLNRVMNENAHTNCFCYGEQKCQQNGISPLAWGKRNSKTEVYQSQCLSYVMALSKLFFL